MLQHSGILSMATSCMVKEGLDRGLGDIYTYLYVQEAGNGMCLPIVQAAVLSSHIINCLVISNNLCIMTKHIIMLADLNHFCILDDPQICFRLSI